MNTAQLDPTTVAGLRRYSRQMKRQATAYRVSSRRCAESAAEFYRSAAAARMRARRAADRPELALMTPADYESAARATTMIADAWLRRSAHADYLAAEYDELSASYARQADRRERDGELVLF